MSENNFGGSFGEFQSIETHSENERIGFDAHQNPIHVDIPHIKDPGPKIGPDFLKEVQSEKTVEGEKDEKEANREKLEKIKEVILEINIDIVSPVKTYKLLVEDLKSMDLFDNELKLDINYYFNQKLVYCINKENIKSGSDVSSDAAMKRKREAAAFVGAKSLHDMVTQLEKIEESGGNDEKIREYWNKRKDFYMNLKEKDIEHLISKEEMLLDSMQNAQKYAALAEKAVRDLMKNSSEYIKEASAKNESLRDLFAKGLTVRVKEATITDDVLSAIDFYVEVGGKSFPVQVKCGSIDSRRGEDERTREFIMNNLVNLVDDKEKFKYKPDGCYYENKMTEKINKFIKKALFYNHNEKGFFVILPRGKGMLRENGDIDENVKKMFFDQFFKEVASLELNQS